MKKPKLLKMQTPDMIINANATISIPGVVKVDIDGVKLGSAVMLLRGFPEGMSLEMTQEDCEKASPGIIDAQQKARGCLVLPCLITIDANGNRTVELVEPKKT